MLAMVITALLGGDAGHADAFQTWVKVHPLICEADGGCRIGCANGSAPRMGCRNGEPVITCEPKPAETCTRKGGRL